MEQWFLLALIAPALFALIVLIDDNLLRNVYRSAHFGAIISGFFASIPLIVFPFINFSMPSFTIFLLGLSTGFLTVIYYYFYFKGLEVDTPSVVLALFSITPAIIPFLAYFFLGESLNPNQYLGFLVILLSSFALTAVNIRKFKFSPALIVVGIGALIFAFISVIQKYIYTTVDFWTGYMLFAAGMVLGALFLSTSTKKGRRFFKEFKKLYKKWIVIFLIVELLGITAEFIINLAVSKGPVSLVKVIEGIQPVYTLLFAVILFPFIPKYLREAAEGNKIKKFFLMFLMIVGLYLIYKN